MFIVHFKKRFVTGALKGSAIWCGYKLTSEIAASNDVAAWREKARENKTHKEIISSSRFRVIDAYYSRV